MWAWWTSVKCGLFSWRRGSTSLGMSQQALTHTHEGTLRQGGED